MAHAAHSDRSNRIVVPNPELFPCVLFVVCASHTSASQLKCKINGISFPEYERVRFHFSLFFPRSNPNGFGRHKSESTSMIISPERFDSI